MKNASRTGNRTRASHMEVPDLNNLATSPVVKLLVSVHEYSTSIHNYNSYNRPYWNYTIIHYIKLYVTLCDDVFVN